MLSDSQVTLGAAHPSCRVAGSLGPEEKGVRVARVRNVGGERLQRPLWDLDSGPAPTALATPLWLSCSCVPSTHLGLAHQGQSLPTMQLLVWRGDMLVVEGDWREGVPSP